jgi:hypothetical protein
MTGAVWTAIGLLAATSLGTLFYLGSKIDALGSRLDGRIDSLGARLDARIDTQGAELSARLDAQASEIRDLRTDLGSRLDALTGRLDDHLRRHAG